MAPTSPKRAPSGAHKGPKTAPTASKSAPRGPQEVVDRFVVRSGGSTLSRFRCAHRRLWIAMGSIDAAVQATIESSSLSVK